MNNNIPNYINFYSCIETKKILELKNLFEQNGWLCRKESWTDFELNNNWSNLSLVITKENFILLNGAIENPEINYFKLIELLQQCSSNFTAELYNESDEIIYNHKSQ